MAIELICGNCSWRTVCGRDDTIARLRLIGLLRRDPDPDDQVLQTLMIESAPRMTCPLCKEKRLNAEMAVVDAAQDAEWQAAVLCELCRQPIPPERLEALPGAKRCVACQGKTEADPTHGEPIEYCPNCGSYVELRVSRGSGITRYRRVCTGDPPCRL